MTKKYDALDLTKFIASIFIVALHSSALYDINPLLNTIINEGIARLGVPFFFLCTSFFLYSKNRTYENTIKYVRRMLVLYLAWFVVYLPKTIFDRIICSSQPIGITIILFIRSFFVTSTFSGSWFIVSCIFCALFYYHVQKLPRNTGKVVTYSACIITYLFAVLCSAYGQLLKPLGLYSFYTIYKYVFSNPFSNIFVGLPYFGLGLYFANCKNIEESEKKQTVPTKLVCGAISLVALLAEVYYTNTYSIVYATDCYFFLLPCVYFLFSILIDIQLSIPCAKQLRVCSTIIFFSQFYWLFILEIVEWLFKITITCGWKFVYAMAGCFITYGIFMGLKKCKRLSWLKLFY